VDGGSKSHRASPRKVGENYEGRHNGDVTASVKEGAPRDSRGTARHGLGVKKCEEGEGRRTQYYVMLA